MMARHYGSTLKRKRRAWSAEDLAACQNFSCAGCGLDQVTSYPVGDQTVWECVTCGQTQVAYRLEFVELGKEERQNRISGALTLLWRIAERLLGA